MKTKRKSRNPADKKLRTKSQRVSSIKETAKKEESTRKLSHDEEGNDFKWTPRESSVASDEEL